MIIERKQKTIMKFGELEKGDIFVINLPDAPCDSVYYDCICVKVIDHEFNKHPEYVAVNLTFNYIYRFEDDTLVEKINMKLVETD